MKKTMTRNIVIMAIVTVIMAVVLSLYIKSTGTVPAADSTASLADGTYTASAQGCLSEVGVTVTITGGKVSNVEDWGKRKLAYEINGLAEGDYTLIDFEADPTAIAELDRVLHIMDAVQRYMITRRNGETTSVESA